MTKKVFLVLALMYVGFVSAQNYVPLLDSINEWHFTTCNNGCLEDKYYTDGDTIANGQPYMILDGYHYISRTFLLREDVTQRQVFLGLAQNDGSIEETMLYDFSLGEGDSMNLKNPISPFSTKAGWFEVDSIKSRPLFDGNDYRHFYLSPKPGNPFSQDNCVWIEGIGSLSLINAPAGKPDINQAGHLSCFFKNTTTIYSNLDSINSCEATHLEISIPTSIALNEFQNLTVSHMEGNQYLVEHREESIDFYIIGLDGKMIKKSQNIRDRVVYVDFATFDDGMYFLVLSNQKNQKVVKISVQ